MPPSTLCLLFLFHPVYLLWPHINMKHSEAHNIRCFIGRIFKFHLKCCTGTSLKTIYQDWNKNQDTAAVAVAIAIFGLWIRN